MSRGCTAAVSCSGVLKLFFIIYYFLRVSFQHNLSLTFLSLYLSFSPLLLLFLFYTYFVVFCVYFVFQWAQLYIHNFVYKKDSTKYTRVYKGIIKILYVHVYKYFVYIIEHNVYKIYPFFKLEDSRMYEK